jgi:hypothetical protein
MSFILDRVLTGPFLITIIRYALVAVGAWLVSNGHLSEEVWQQVLGGIMAVVFAFLGGADATKNKAVVDGKSVPLASLPKDAQTEIKAAAYTPAKRRTLVDIFVGK